MEPNTPLPKRIAVCPLKTTYLIFGCSSSTMASLNEAAYPPFHTIVPPGFIPCNRSRQSASGVNRTRCRCHVRSCSRSRLLHYILSSLPLPSSALQLSVCFATRPQLSRGHIHVPATDTCIAVFPLPDLTLANHGLSVDLIPMDCLPRQTLVISTSLNKLSFKCPARPPFLQLEYILE